MIYKFVSDNFGKNWEINVLGSGSPDTLLVRQWARIDFLSRPQIKESGLYPRKMTLPFVDRQGLRGYLTERLFDETLEFEVNLDSNLFFKGKSYNELAPRPLLEDEFDSSCIVSDGLESLKTQIWTRETYTITEFLRECFDATGIVLPIKLYTDWDEDNSVGVLPNVNRITIGEDGQTVSEVLDAFAKTYGYQIFQWNGYWVVAPLVINEPPLANLGIRLNNPETIAPAPAAKPMLNGKGTLESILAI